MATAYRPTVPWLAMKIAAMTGAEVGRVDVKHASGKVEWARKSYASRCALPGTAARLVVPGEWGCRWWEHAGTEAVQFVLEHWYLNGVITVGPKGTS